jgi:DNA-binding transcriptional ArsR family regulator
MDARREFRDRADVEVAVLDALCDRPEEGLTVFELRSHVDSGIDELEGALAALNDDGLVEADANGRRTVIKPDERVVPDPGEDEAEPSLVERIVDRLGL